MTIQLNFFKKITMAGKIKKAIRLYLGREEKVPVRVGKSKAAAEKNQ